MSEPEILPLSLSSLAFKPAGFEPVMQSAAANSIFAPFGAQPDIAEEDPYQRGLSEGQRLAATAFEAERAHYQKLIASASELQPEPSDELASLIAEAVERLVTQIVGDVEIDAALLHRRASQAASLVSNCDAARTMWLHPDDLALLDQDAFAIPFMPDPDAARGSIRIDCSSSWIEHGTAMYLEQLHYELGGVGATE